MPDLDLSTPGAAEAMLFNAFDQATRADPWPLCHALRELDPIYRSPFGAWILTGYEHSLMALRDPRFSVDPKQATSLAGLAGDALGPAARGFDDMIMFMDPPSHTRVRGLISKAFTPRVVEAMRPRIQELVDSALDAAEARGHMDVVGDLAFRLPAAVISDMLGVPPSDAVRFRTWSSEITPILDPFVPPQSFDRIVDAGGSLIAYFDDLIEERRRAPGDDLLSNLIRAKEEDDRLSSDELRATCIFLLIAGHETTMNLIGNGVLALLRELREWERLRADPSLIKTAVEELCRHDGPGILTARYALEDVELDGKTVAQGDVVLVVFGAANRDPAHFPDPDRLDVGRDPNRHLAFSAGPHFCLGASLARAEAQIAIATLIRRAPSLELAEEPRWRDIVTFRGLEALRVTL